MPRSGSRREARNRGFEYRAHAFLRRWLPDHVAATPDGADDPVAARTGELLAQFAYENVDDLNLRFIHPAVKMVQERFLGQDHPLAQNQKFQDRVFLAGKVDFLAVDGDFPAVKIEFQPPDANGGLAEALAATDNGLHPREQLRLVVRLDDEI